MGGRHQPNDQVCITKSLEFDAGHRLPYHDSQCRHMHGHRYRLEVTVEGPVQSTKDSPESGMVTDFSKLKTLANQYIVDHWDHAFLVYREDQVVLEFLETLPNHKTVKLESIPTAENLAAIIFETLAPVISQEMGPEIQLTHIRLFETPNSWADIHRN